MSKPKHRTNICQRCSESFSYTSARIRKYDDECLQIVRQEIRLRAARSPEHISACRLVGLSNKGISRNSGSKHGNWKGDQVGKEALHTWVIRKLGRPSMCEQCKRSDVKTEWANKSQRYKRDLTDWLRLCRSCHLKYDIGMGVRNGR